MSTDGSRFESCNHGITERVIAMVKSPIRIVSPALAVDNNGNWQTAQRWCNFLVDDFAVSISRELDAVTRDDCLIALHARRSAAAIRRYKEEAPNRPIILIMTGTDLYRDIKHDPHARQSLDLANYIVLLQSAGLSELDETMRARAVVIHQSAPALSPISSVLKPMDVALVGHLRAEKDPMTAMAAFELLDAALGVRMIHIGAALDPTIGAAASALAASNKRYQWRGALPHVTTREVIRQSRLLVICSVMEGGANVVIEAITAGTPVLASRISGNVGMLGADYMGYFQVGDAHGLAGLIGRCCADDSFYQQLSAACARRATLFSPERERQEVIKLVRSALNAHPTGPFHE